MLGIFLDTETTGLDYSVFRPIEIACKIVNLTNDKPVAEYQSVIQQSRQDWDLRDPTSIEVNGFTWDEVQRGENPAVVKEVIVSLFEQHRIKRGEAFFICQNPSFDRGFFNQIVPVSLQRELDWPYHWLDLASMYWAVRVLKAKAAAEAIPEKITVSKNEIAVYCGLPKEEAPHRAMNGVNHLMSCYLSLFN